MRPRTHGFAAALVAALAVAAGARAQATAAPAEAARLERARTAHAALDAEVTRVTALRESLERGFAADRERRRFAPAGSGPANQVFIRHRDALPTARSEVRQLAEVRTAAAQCELARLDAVEAQDGALAEELGRGVDRYARLESELVAYEAVLTEYRAFLDAQVFWTADMRPVRRESASEAKAFVQGAIEPRMLRGAVEDVRTSIAERPVAWLLSAGLVALLAAGWPGGRSLLDRIAPAHASASRLPATIRAALLAVARALPWPLGLHLFGALLGPSSTGDASAALAHACTRMAVPAFWLMLVISTCARGGLAVAQLGWTPSVADTLRRAARRSARLVLPFIGLMAFASWSTELEGAAEVARLACVAALATLAAISYGVFGPRNGVFAGIVARHPTGWIATLAPLARAVLTAVPAAVAVAALLGYSSTAEIVLEDMLRSWTVLFAVAVGATAFERAGQGAFHRLDLAGDMDPAEELRFDRQVRGFGRLAVAAVAVVGLLWAWKEQLPALGSMASTELWSVGARPATATAPAVAGVPVTIADLGLFVGACLMTAVLVRDLPGLLNVLVLRRFPLDRSLRYAAVALARNVMVIVGLVLALGALHIRWEDVQWLAAGVTVGLGFGLQEIFANFVSGVIVLVERPVRVGDLVTVGGVTGHVTRISTRATQILDYDNKDVVIPNKTLITNPIVNWTLGDTTVREIVRVGVAYGTDLEAASALLREVATGTKGILRSPAPAVQVQGFGASSVDLDVVVWLSTDDGTRAVRHELCVRIDRACRERGIEIAFPQLDVHVRDLPGRAGAAGPEGPRP
jgi:potassium efflux system protein